VKAIIVKTTCASKEEAKYIANILVKERLAACVQLNEIESIYFWKDEICSDNETLLSIKTKKELFSKVQSRILELHSYDVPQIIEIEISNISEDYLKFIKENTI
jgi:periplasmic divalent cation tolerance protein